MRHWILDSRVGLRVLGMFALAAGAPMLLLATLSQRTVDATLARGEAALIASTAKSTSLQTLERLRVARQSLDVVHPRANQAVATGVSAPLLAVVEVDGLGQRRVAHGGRRAEALLSVPLGAAAAAPSTRLLLVDAAAPGLPPGIVLVAYRDGAARLGLVDPAFLWDGADELPAGIWLCALANGGRPLFCSDDAVAETAAQRLRDETWAARGAAPPPQVVKGLFLGADFAAPDWHFVAGPDLGGTAAAADGVRDTLPIAAAAGLLLAFLLGLVQTRRTMKPLVALTEGARAFARRRFGTRLDIRSADGFGELAGAFNDMAARLEAQFAELEALAEIDRDIVGHSDLQHIHARIAGHLRRLLPRRRVAVLQFIDANARRALCLLAMPGADAPQALTLDLDGAAADRLRRAEDWMAFDGLVPWPDRAEPGAQVLPLRWRDRCHGLIAIGAGPADELDDDTLRQVLELRNRAAIAGSAAEREETLWREARYDSVTGLLNRQGLDEQLRRLIAAAGPAQHTLAVVFIDLDRFKTINDSLGHAAGDQALRGVAERLRQCLPAGALAARPAGDEFVLLLPDCGGAEHDGATALAQAVCDSLAQALVIRETAFFLRASVGIAHCSDPQQAPERLLRSADHAMYQAKRQGGGRYAVFDARLDARATRRAWIETDLPQACERGELRLLYQPRIDLAGARMDAVEALIRWQHPVHGLCSPAEFIAIAEESELIEHLGRWVIDTACAQVRAWRDQGFADLRVALNLSGRQLASERLLPDLNAALARHGVRPTDLELEITESLLVEQTEAIVARLHELRRLGMTLALDDFGTGYSSMSYLRTLPIDTLKIDRAFVKDLGHDRTSLAVARAIVALASSLGMRTVAEGVERGDQWLALESLRCDEVQGFLFSPPVDAQAITRLLAAPPDWSALRNGELRTASTATAG